MTRGFNSGEHRFMTTHWTLVRRAADEMRRLDESEAGALEELCRIYWPSLYAYARACRMDEQASCDVTQAFFARLLERNDFALADEARGKFRWFLLTAFKNFLTNHWRAEKALKRGGAIDFVALDALPPAQWEALDPGDSKMAPDRVYERRWAQTILAAARERLADELSGQKAERFAVLSQFLPGAEPRESHAVCAKKLKMSEGAMKTELSRLRKRYRDALRAEVARTLSDPGETDDEIRYLVAASCG